MTKSVPQLVSTVIASVFILITTPVQSAPISLTDSQLDSVSGGSFVCPVIIPGSDNADLSFPQPDGTYYTVLGPTVGAGVPAHATNNDGAATPVSNYLAPGDVGYTAIWY